MSSRSAAVRTRNATGAATEPRHLPTTLPLERWQAWRAGVDWVPWAIIGLGALLRIFWLDVKPPHFDEGINGWFVDQMTKNGYYRYDPTNYHGPLHFYILFLAQTLFGRNLWALRIPVVLGSMYAIWLALRYEPFVGRTASRLAALAMAVSPGFVFYGRYSIHEVWLLIFSMLFVMGLLGLWRFGDRKSLWATGLGVAGMILTKETYIIHVGCALIALPVAWVSHKLTRAENVRPARRQWDEWDLVAVAAVGLGAIIFFYSGTFMNWPGVKGLWETFDAWFKTGQGGKSGHEKPWFYWLKLIGQYETPIAIGLIGCLLCQFFKAIEVRFLAIYGVGVLMAYSIVAYKTPWCIISIVWPLLFIFGAAFTVVAAWARQGGYIVAGVVLAVSLVFGIRLNYFRCTTDTEPYVYVQTYNDIWKLTDPLLKLARRNPVNYQLVGHMIRPSAYPLPWVLGDFTRIGYYERDNMPTQMDAAFLVVQDEKIAEVEGKLQDAYYTMPFTIRPYQDTSKLFLSARAFKDFFPGKTPDFSGKNAQ